MKAKDDLENGLRLAIDAVGNADKLAKSLGISPQAISQWTRIPMKRVFEIEQITGIRRHRLRPDYFGKDAGKESQSEAAQ